MIQLIRNNRLLAAIVALLVSVSVGGMSLSTARTPEHPPVIALAVLPANSRIETERRYGVVRSIRSRVAGRLRKIRVRNGLRTLKRHRRIPVHEWYARGPPAEHQ